jgi:hypothetical protein
LRERPPSWYAATLGRLSYEFLLYLATWVPPFMPIVERYVFYMQYGWSEGETGNAVQKSYEALTMDCLFSQFVNEVNITRFSIYILLLSRISFFFLLANISDRFGEPLVQE